MLCLSGFELYSRWVPLISTVQCEAVRLHFLSDVLVAITVVVA